MLQYRYHSKQILILIWHTISYSAYSGDSARDSHLFGRTAVKMHELLEYLKNSDPFYQTKIFPRIVERVNYFKVQKEGVTIMCEIADKIRQEGLIEGKIESILELLEELGNIPKQLIQRIRKETNSEVLSKWHKYAAKASSLAEFEAKM